MGTDRNTGVTRRGFLGLTAGTAAGAALGMRSFKAQAAVPHANETWDSGTVIPSTCNMCVNRCGIRCRVVNGVLEKIDGDIRNPRSRGGTCAKGQAGIMSVYDPDRIKHPMIRVGKRGEGKWRRASWDEAFEYVADNLNKIMEKHGPESLLWSSTTDLTEQFFVRLGTHMPTPNFARHATLCLASRNVGYFATMGGVPASDLTNAKYILMFGANRTESFELPHNWTLIEGIKNGAKLTVVDPRMTYTATKGEWVPIRPRTDMALTLALMHVLINEGLYDKEFVANNTHGFDELEAHVADNTPEWAAKETEIPADKIVAMAREMAAAAPAVVIYPGRRTSWYTNDTQFRRTLPMLMALLGAFDAPGSHSLGGPKAKLGAFEWEIEPFDVAERFDHYETRFPLANHEDGGYVSLRNAILDGSAAYPVKGWMIYKQNPIAAVLDGKKNLQMAEQMDFICAIDVQPSETAWMADIILPETTYLERLDPLWAPASPREYVGIRQPVVPPQGEAKPILDIIKGLVKALDAKHEFDTPLSQVFNFTIEEFIDAQLKGLPIDRKTLMQEGIWLGPETKPNYGAYRSGKKKFKTPSGKIEFVSERFRRNNVATLPEYETPKEVDGKQRLVSGRHAWFTHQRGHANNLWLHELYPENEAWIHPEIAKQKGITEGEEVLVKSSVGEIRIKAKVTPRIRKDTVFICHGFGGATAGQTTARGKGGADYMLMESAGDEITDNQATHETFVEVLKV
jgi:thiosulfate reductase / polysulfide reductase chain A